MELSFSRIRQSLRGTGFGGVTVLPGTFPSLYATTVSGAGATLNHTVDNPSEWAVISYVQTNSPTEGVGGMPAYVATEVEDVLDALVATGVIKNRALYWESVGGGRAGAEAARVLHCISAPMICVPPIRTREYSRYQRPDRWDANTHLALVTFENMLRSCETCSRLCPDEFDVRLLNIAAALQTSPVADAMLAAVGRGAFVSFESFDRYAYTIEWLLVLLHLALESGDYVATLIEKSIELYGQPLFRPCARCVSSGKEVHGRNGIQPNLKLLEECISQLVVQVSRFTLTHPEDRATMNLWTLPGLQRTPGEHVMWKHTKNEKRLEVLSRRTAVSLTDLRLIAAGMLRGRPSEGSCIRHSNKWTTALICANPVSLCSAFIASSSQGGLSKRTYSQVVRDILEYSPFAFGSFIPFNPHPRYTQHFHPDIRKCRRAPKCTGVGQLCLFNEYSGIVPPESPVRFLRDSFLTREEIVQVADENLVKLASGVIYARVCYLSQWRFSTGKEICCACQPARRALNESRRLILLAWDPAFRHTLSMKSQVRSRRGKEAVPEKAANDKTPCNSTPQSGGTASRKTCRGDLADENNSVLRKRPRVDSDVRQSKATSGTGADVDIKIKKEASPKSTGQKTPQKSVDKQEDTEMAGTNGKEDKEKNKISGKGGSDEKQIEMKGVKEAIPEPSAGPEIERRESTGNTRVPVAVPTVPVSQVNSSERRTDAGILSAYAQSPVLSYIVVDALKMEHVLVSGVDTVIRGPPSLTVCTVCGGNITVLELELEEVTLEIHSDQLVNSRQAATRLVAGMRRAHDIYPVTDV